MTVLDADVKHDCPCQNELSNGPGKLFPDNEDFEKFKQLREKCSVLKRFISEDQLKRIESNNSKASQSSFYYIAFVRGYLHRITKVLHKFTEGKDIKITKQYEKDLNEKWLSQEKDLEKHRKARIYFGKFIELLFAGFLVEKGFEILDLEAWNAKSPDIYAKQNGVDFVFECKFIGEHDELFEKVFVKKEDKEQLREAKPYAINEVPNYVLFRICEVAEQLSREKNSSFVGKNVAVVILDNFAPFTFKEHIGFGYWNKTNHVFDEYEDFKIKMIAKDKKNEIIFANPQALLDKLDDYLIFDASEYKFKFTTSYRNILDNYFI